jgi:hypothetical protein
VLLNLTWAALLAACVTPPPPPAPEPVAAPAPVVAPAPEPPPPPSPPPPPPPALSGVDALREGQAAYQSGDYRRSETRLQDALRLGLPAADQIQAHKTLAFIFCISRRNKPCEDAFQTAFTVARSANLSFELSRAERGHPLWGPVYNRVQQRQPKR